jgi:hypothetical protein
MLVLSNRSLTDSRQDYDGSAGANFSWINLCLDSNESPDGEGAFRLTGGLNGQKLLECGRGKNSHPFVGVAIRVTELVGINVLIHSVKINTSVGSISWENGNLSRPYQTIILPVEFVVNLDEGNHSVVKPSHYKHNQKSIKSAVGCLNVPSLIMVSIGTVRVNVTVISSSTILASVETEALGLT